MKLPLLLTQFLYKYKRLSLPGIGIFTLDPTAVIPDGHNKNAHVTALGIEFKNAVIHEPDNDLIDYIRANTGKIKPVAVADLDSYLSLGTEMLNLGKPFFLEGIGIITKNREGGFEFNPGEYSIVKQEDGSQERVERPGKRKSVLEESQFEAQPNSGRKVLFVLAIVVGLSVVGWGGYMMYKKNSPVENTNDISATTNDTAAVKKDTVHLISASDSPAKTNPVAPTALKLSKDSVLYKFIILQTYNKERALKRYNQLLGFKLKINLFNKDSTFFKVYFAFPAVPKDTIHIKDSLSREYAHSVQIEQ